MAQKTTVLLVDDLDGGEASESISFGLDGVEYAIDLSEENAKRLRGALDDFVLNGRRIGGRHLTVKPARVRQPTATGEGRGPDANNAIREWARQRGVVVSDRGRIPQDVLRDYDAAHAR